MPLSSSTNFKRDQFLSHIYKRSHKKKRRPNVGLVEPVTAAAVTAAATVMETLPNDHDAVMANPPDIQQLQPQLQPRQPPQPHRKNVAYYRQCHERAQEEENDYPRVERPQIVPIAASVPVASMAPSLTDHRRAVTHNTRSTHLSLTSILVEEKDMWNQGLPLLLLLIVLQVQWEEVLLQSPPRPDYETLVAHLRQIHQERDALLDRFQRFTNLTRKRTKEWEQRLWQAEQKKGAALSSSSSSKMARHRLPLSAGEGSSNNNHNHNHNPSAITMTKETVIPPQEQQQRRHSSKSRRITESPDRIRQNQLTAPSNTTTTSRRDGDNNNIHPDEIQSFSHHGKKSSPNKQQKQTSSEDHHSTATSHRQLVPNPFQHRTSAPIRHRRDEKPHCPIVAPNDDSQTVLPPTIPYITASKDYHATLPNPQRTRGILDHPRMDSTSSTTGSSGKPQVPKDDDSQTITPPAAAEMSSCAAVAAKRKRDTHPAQLSSKNKSYRKSPSNTASANPKSTTLGTGWISSRHAKDFVSEVVPTPPHPAASVPASLTTDSHHPSLSRATSPKRTTARENRASSAAAAAATTTTTTAGDKTANEQPYCEVVRKKAERETLKAYDCPECGKFIDAIMEGDENGVYNRHELMCASRHRYRFTPPETPDQFWELSFVDSIEARK